jgi:hypothetical protein
VRDRELYPVTPLGNLHSLIAHKDCLAQAVPLCRTKGPLCILFLLRWNHLASTINLSFSLPPRCYFLPLYLKNVVMYSTLPSIGDLAGDLGHKHTSSLPDLAARGDQGGAALSTRSPPAVLVPSPSACSGGGGEVGSGLSAL